MQKVNEELNSQKTGNYFLQNRVLSATEIQHIAPPNQEKTVKILSVLPNCSTYSALGRELDKRNNTSSTYNPEHYLAGVIQAVPMGSQEQFKYILSDELLSQAECNGYVSFLNIANKYFAKDKQEGQKLIESLVNQGKFKTHDEVVAFTMVTCAGQNNGVIFAVLDNLKYLPESCNKQYVLQNLVPILKTYYSMITPFERVRFDARIANLNITEELLEAEKEFNESTERTEFKSWQLFSEANDRVGLNVDSQIEEWKSKQRREKTKDRNKNAESDEETEKVTKKILTKVNDVDIPDQIAASINQQIDELVEEQSRERIKRKIFTLFAEAIGPNLDREELVAKAKALPHIANKILPELNVLEDRDVKYWPDEISIILQDPEKFDIFHFRNLMDIPVAKDTYQTFSISVTGKEKELEEIERRVQNGVDFLIAMNSADSPLFQELSMFRNITDGKNPAQSRKTEAEKVLQSDSYLIVVLKQKASEIQAGRTRIEEQIRESIVNKTKRLLGERQKDNLSEINRQSEQVVAELVNSSSSQVESIETLLLQASTKFEEIQAMQTISTLGTILRSILSIVSEDARSDTRITEAEKQQLLKSTKDAKRRIQTELDKIKADLAQEKERIQGNTLSEQTNVNNRYLAIIEKIK